METSENVKQNRFLPYLVLLWINQPSISYSSIATIGVHLDAFKANRYIREPLIEGMMEELFFAINPKTPLEVFDVYNISRFIGEHGDRKDQEELLTLLRKRELR